MQLGSRGRYPYHEGKHLIVALTEQFVYADESGTHVGAKHCLLGGYRASPRQWKKFDTDWQAILKGEGIDVFHSNVFFNRKVIKNPQENPYLKWSDNRADNFLSGLLDVIVMRVVYPVGTSVVV